MFHSCCFPFSLSFSPALLVCLFSLNHNKNKNKNKKIDINEKKSKMKGEEGRKGKNPAKMDE